MFSGQGLQHGGTLGWLDDGKHTRLLRQHLGLDWRRQMADDSWVRRNAVAQPLLTGLALGAWGQIGIDLPAPAVVAGYSVGELAAFCVAGVFDAASAMQMALQRAAAMDRSASAMDTGLFAVSGLAASAVATLCNSFALETAIDSGPGSVVLGGLRGSLQSAAEAARAQGGHVTPLRIDMASHTRWIRSAATEFGAALREHAFQQPTTHLVNNFNGQRVSDVDDARHALANQIAHVLRWDDCMHTMAERGVCCVLEVGAGCALARAWNSRYPDIPARAADEFRSAQAVRDWILRHAAH